MTPAESPSFSSVPYPLRVILARPALWGCLVLGVLVALLLPLPPAQWLARVIIGWNVGAGVYLIFLARQIFATPRVRIRVRAMLQQDGRYLALGLALLAALLCLGLVVAELSVARDFQGPERIAHMALAGLTWLTAWALTQAMLALHYAQSYFFAQVQGLPEVLTFADGRTADHQDFLGFTMALGTLGRTDKVRLISPELRALGVVQRVLAVLFNLTLLVLVVNLVSALG